MWAISNRTPYRAGKTWARDMEGVHQWIVAVKATYTINPDGAVALADEQIEPLLAPEYTGDPGRSSLRYDAELVSPKPTTDILVNGTAYAPGARPSVDFPVSMAVGPVRKTLRVRGNRRWRDGGASKPEPVSALPIVYERAYGGYDSAAPDPTHHVLDSRNPVGCGLPTGSRGCVGATLPNFEYPSGDLRRAGPAGFGAIDSFWSPRLEFAGTYDKAWEADRKPLLPNDWDSRSLLCSPPDQRPNSHLRGGEPVELVNLTPSGSLRFFLPKVYLTFRTTIDGRIEEHRSRLATVIIEPDDLRLHMVWLTSLTCRNDVDYLEETIVAEKPYQ